MYDCVSSTINLNTLPLLYDTQNDLAKKHLISNGFCSVHKILMFLLKVQCENNKNETINVLMYIKCKCDGIALARRWID